jgi:hypothetical protein
MFLMFWNLGAGVSLFPVIPEQAGIQFLYLNVYGWIKNITRDEGAIS